MIRKLTSATTAAFSAGASVIIGSIVIRESYMEQSNLQNSHVVTVHTPTQSIAQVDEKDEWEIEKEKCSFCKHFLQSPCRDQFKYWSKCVDASKESGEDFVVKCQLHTDALLNCTSEYPDFFSKLSDESDDVVDIDEIEEKEILISDSKDETIINTLANDEKSSSSS